MCPLCSCDAVVLALVIQSQFNTYLHTHYPIIHTRTHIQCTHTHTNTHAQHTQRTHNAHTHTHTTHTHTHTHNTHNAHTCTLLDYSIIECLVITYYVHNYVDKS